MMSDVKQALGVRAGKPGHRVGAVALFANHLRITAHSHSQADRPLQNHPPCEPELRNGEVRQTRGEVLVCGCPTDTENSCATTMTLITMVCLFCAELLTYS